MSDETQLESEELPHLLLVLSCFCASSGSKSHK